ncbi:ATP-grasp domain-containing protein [Streptomyces sp. bgisy153]|uniref:ATP-grasp domain-containing protein n=1 Tax=Streptomyces sp. bgisy153 TaxID=3413793 RepID=UPI003D755D4F
MTILLATHRRATEVDRLVDELRRRALAFCRVNMGVAEDGCSVSFAAGERPRVVFTTDAGAVDGDDVVSGWYHQPAIATIPPDASTGPSGRDAVITSYLNTWTGALAQLRCGWLNAPWDVDRSANKILQNAAAARAGLSVPRTVVGNVPERVRAVFGGRRVVAKNIASLHRAWGTRSTLSFLTRTVDTGALRDAQIAACPVIYQERLKPWREHRVVVAGEESFVATIDRSGDDGAVDVRATPSALAAFRRSAIDEGALKGLRTILASFGLRYCSADLMESEAGEYSFLDLNSCGAWWWVDDLHGGAVTRALADALSGR